jgi:hypothetical protein
VAEGPVPDKSEIRSTQSETNPKSAIQKPLADFGFRILIFGFAADFALRASDFLAKGGALGGGADWRKVKAY